jgi:hypothetical protein
MTGKVPNLQWEIDQHHGRPKTKNEMAHEKLLNDAIEKEEVQENLDYIRGCANTRAGQN